MGGHDAKARKSERWGKREGKTRPISAEARSTRGSRPTTASAPDGSRRAEGVRGTRLHFTAARRAAVPARTSPDPPSERPTGSREPAGGRRAGRAWTGRRGGRALGPAAARARSPALSYLDSEGHRRPAERAPGRDTDRPDTWALLGRSSPQTRGRCTWPGRSARLPGESCRRSPPAPGGAGGAGRSEEEPREGGPLPSLGLHLTTDQPPRLGSVTSKGSPQNLPGFGATKATRPGGVRGCA